MAKSRVETVEIKPAVPAVMEKQYVLEMNEDEVKLLIFLVGSTTGDAYVVASSLFEALQSLLPNYKYSNDYTAKSTDAMYGSINIRRK